MEPMDNRGVTNLLEECRLQLAASEAARKDIEERLFRAQSELRHAEENMRLAEQRKHQMQDHFKHVVSRIGEAILVLDRSGQIRYANLAAKVLFGRRDEELVGQAVGLPLEPCENVQIEIPRALEVGGPTAAEASLLEVEWEGEPAYLASLHDLTPPTAAHLALRETERKLDQLLQTMVEGVVMVDAAGEVTYANPSAERILNLRQEQISGVNLLYNRWGLIDTQGEPLPHQKLAVSTAMQELRVVENVEHGLITPTGEVKWLSVNAAPLINSNGQLYGAIASFRDVTHAKHAEAALRKSEERLRYQILHDPLTHLPNRLYFMEHLRHALDKVNGGNGYRAAVLYLDLDRFKVVNDSLGHPYGDEMLVAIAQRLPNCLRPGDLVARFGGDEFAILVDNFHQLDDLVHIARRIINDLSHPISIRTHDVFTSASIGIAVAKPGTDRPEDLLRDADTAMYRAKAGGKARFAIFQEEMHAHSMALLELEASLRQAVEQQEFEVHYQPIVSLNPREITGVEALLRWRHPKLGIIPPDDFIPLAEENGLIMPIGKWVLQQACSQLKAWHNDGLSRLRVAVNISSRQLEDPGFPAIVRQALENAGLEPEFLELEITERVAMNDTEQTVSILNELNAIGVQISIDDFGNSYSALGYLNRFPVQTLKIDRSFVSDISENQEDAAIATAIIVMAHGLKLKVIAEGVQNERQLDFLTLQNCDEIQGFLIRPAVPAEAIPALLLGQKELLEESLGMN